jgi:hypothetical protein
MFIIYPYDKKKTDLLVMLGCIVFISLLLPGYFYIRPHHKNAARLPGHFHFRFFIRIRMTDSRRQTNAVTMTTERQFLTHLVAKVASKQQLKNAEHKP